MIYAPFNLAEKIYSNISNYVLLIDVAKDMGKKNLKDQVVAKGNLPIHIAIIMDGNGRWAKKRGLPRTAGHRAGVKTVKKIVRIAGDIGLKYLTLFTFSTENWKRPPGEVSAIMKLLGETTKRELSELLENNVRLITTGNIEQLPSERRDILLGCHQTNRQ